MRSSCSGLALSPARMAAGSPGVSRSSKKTNSATTPITGMAARMRRSRYPSIVIPCPVPSLRVPKQQILCHCQYLGPPRTIRQSFCAVQLRHAGTSPAVTENGFFTYLIQRCQQSGHQAPALGETVDFDMFVQRMRIGAANAEAIERRDSHRAGKIAVGAAAGATVRKLDAHLLCHTARLFIKRHGSRVGLPYRPRHAACHFERNIVGRSGQRQHPLDAAIEIVLALGHAQRFAAAGGSDAIDPLAAMHDADTEGAILRR